ncbi:class I SAM-dependent methyltransferase [bacterium AH-315-F18]|nr:class I SAM-dependent methyltransferase [bacterium AH-315-F18]
MDCPGCGAITKVLSLDEYQQLDVSYDPGELFTGKSRDFILAELAVESKKDFLLGHLGAKAATQGLRMLDIGCGMGGYLLAAQDLGMEARGYEPSVEHSEVGRSLGLDIVTDFFGEESEEDGAFDLILSTHVIEHIYDPDVFLKTLIAKLKVGGLLIIITPNAGALLVNWTGGSWTMLKAVDHVSMLSQRTFGSFKAGAGGWTFKTSEYPWEFALSFGASMRDRLREWRAGASVEGAERERVRVGQAQAPKLQNVGGFSLRGLVKPAAMVLSLPFYLYASAFDSKACLIALYTRSEA